MDKEYLKSVIYSYEVRITSVITEGVLNRASKRDVMLKVGKEIDSLKFLNRTEKSELWDYSLKFYRHTVAAAGRKIDLIRRGDAIYSVLREDTEKLEKMKNDIVDNIEYRNKHKELVKTLMMEDNKFFYCTELKDAASDHVNYQGRIYFKGNASYSDEEREYIENNGLLSVESVTISPPYLTTRRNCRHRFVPVSFSSVKTGVSRPEESFHMISYEEERYRFYRDRLKLMINVKKVFSDQGLEPSQLKTDVRKTRVLVNQWNRARKEAEKKSDRK